MFAGRWTNTRFLGNIHCKLSQWRATLRTEISSRCQRPLAQVNYERKLSCCVSELGIFNRFDTSPSTGRRKEVSPPENKNTDTSMTSRRNSKKLWGRIIDMRKAVLRIGFRRIRSFLTGRGTFWNPSPKLNPSTYQLYDVYTDFLNICY